MTDVPARIREAYSRTGRSWADGPARLYDRLAAVLVGDSPIPLDGTLVLDAGAGTGAVSRAALAVGAEVFAVDAALGMLAHDRQDRPLAAVADIQRLPLAAARFDVAATAFVLNHLDEPALAVAELARVVRTGGWVLASTFRDDWDHPAKQAVEEVAAAHGYVPPSWYHDVKTRTATAIGRAELLASVGRRGGLVDVEVVGHEVDAGITDAPTLVSWRLGMPTLGPFVAALDSERRQALVAEAVVAVGAVPEPLRPQVLHLRGQVPGRA